MNKKHNYVLSLCVVIALPWVLGNLMCSAFKKNIWPFSSYDMFTHYKNVSDAAAYVTVVKTNEGIIYEAPEANLPTILYWRDRDRRSLTAEESLVYARSWLKAHPELEKSARLSPGSLLIVKKSTLDSELRIVSQTLLELKVAEIK